MDRSLGTSVPGAQLAFRRKYVKGYFSETLVNSPPQCWQITSIEPFAQSAWAPAPGSSLMPFLSLPGLHGQGLKCHHELLIPVRCRGILQINGQTFGFKPLPTLLECCTYRETDHLEQADLASLRPVSWVLPAFLPARQTVKVFWAWRPNLDASRNANVKAVQTSWTAAGHPSSKKQMNYLGLTSSFLV